jgi:hypothetical protein
MQLIDQSIDLRTQRRLGILWSPSQSQLQQLEVSIERLRALIALLVQ